MNEFLKIYILFWLFSIMGWVIEVFVCSIDEKKIVNRGFLIGPYCPIYGFGGVSMLLFSPFKDYPAVVFILSLVVCSFIEYITSFLMEKLFHVRWWDYSNDSFNINGRVCLRNAIAFGSLGVICTTYLNPMFLNILGTFSTSCIYILASIIFIVTAFDIIISFNAMKNIKKIINKNLNSFKNIDATNDIKKLIKETLKISYLQKRLIKTYHLLEKETKSFAKKIEKIEGVSSYAILLTSIVIGFILGLIISLIKNNYGFIPLLVSLSILLSYSILKWVVKK